MISAALETRQAHQTIKDFTPGWGVVIVTQPEALICNTDEERKLRLVLWHLQNTFIVTKMQEVLCTSFANFDELFGGQ